MNTNDMTKFFTPAYKNVMGTSSDARIHIFELVFDTPIYEEYVRRHAYDDFPMSEVDRRKCRALAGPHGKAIFKMLLAQKGIKPERTTSDPEDRTMLQETGQGST